MLKLFTVVRIGVVTAVLGAGLAVTAAALSPHAGDFLTANSSSSAEISLATLARNSVVYAADGTQLGVLHGPENREPVTLDQISEPAIRAVLVTEDEGFYEHDGVNVRAIIRALVENVQAGDIEQGGSTITQQLVKNSVLADDTQDLERKIPEAALAWRLEQDMEKDEILELYLNTVYFGSGAYGIESAAGVYFGKTAAELDYGDGAMLAALIANPSSRDPTRFPDEARFERQRVLGRLVESGDITEEQYEEYRNRALPEVRQQTSTLLSDPGTDFTVADDQIQLFYFIEEVKQALLDDPRIGATRAERVDAVFAGGLRIYTTIDLEAQAQAEAAVAQHLPFDERNFTVALAAVEPSTGRVQAMVGGPGFDEFQFNIATQKGRPTGSSFKTFVLAAAMEAGYVPGDEVNGSGECEFPNPGQTPDPYIAENFGGGDGSLATIRSQTLRSSNCAYLRLGQIVGLSNVIATAEALGVTSQGLQPVLSAPLGPFDITPLDMATAYGAIANDGLSIVPRFIDRVEDRDGNIIYEAEPDARRAISEDSARLTTAILEANVRGGTGTNARLTDQPSAGKTGTAQDFGDAWFVGFTPYLATAVWMGNPDERVPMRNVGGRSAVTGGSFPAQIWGTFNEAYHASLPMLEFNEPPPTRGGDRLYSPDEDDSPCGDIAAEIDEDGDGDPEECLDLGPFNYIGECPALLEPQDLNEDGEFDICAVPTTTTTSTTTTLPSVPSTPDTSDPPGTTSPPPTTTAPPATTAAITTTSQ